jgi:palmitoyl-protein thioesterase
LNNSIFLPYLNNEKPENYTNHIIDRFASLNGAMFVMFTEDTVIYPKESSWFWELQEDNTILPLNETEFYKQDLIGLRTLEN